MSKLPLPTGFTSWLAYAVATMDTRTLNIESLAGDGPEVSREEFQAAAEAELAEVEALKSDAKRAHDALSLSPELNMANYNESEVCELNDAVITAYRILGGDAKAYEAAQAAKGADDAD